MSDRLTVYVANGTVLHHASRWGWNDVQLHVNGEPVPLEFPQALPPDATITARRTSNVLDHHVDKDGNTITPATYEAEQGKYRDHDGEFLSDEDELAWRIYQKGIKPVYTQVVEDVKLEVVAFRTHLSGEPMISCAPSYSALLGDRALETGAYFSYDPDEMAMLRVALSEAGMDETKLKAGESIESIASSTYDGHRLVTNDPHLCPVHAVTLEEAKAQREAHMQQVREIVRAFKGRHDPRPLTRGEFYAIIDKTIHEFARCRVYACSKDVAAAIQHRLKELLRRIGNTIVCPKCNSGNVECYGCIDCDNSWASDCKEKVGCYKCRECGNEWKGLEKTTRRMEAP